MLTHLPPQPFFSPRQVRRFRFELPVSASPVSVRRGRGGRKEGWEAGVRLARGEGGGKGGNASPEPLHPIVQRVRAPLPFRVPSQARLAAAERIRANLNGNWLLENVQHFCFRELEDGTIERCGQR